MAVLQPIYDDKVNKILELLAEGLTREEVAEKYRYSSHRSLNGYMKRKNFTWDKQQGTYVPIGEVKKLVNLNVDFPTDRVRQVVMELAKEGASAKEVAIKVGFENHLEMASYMKAKGFEWSQELGNYICTETTSPTLNKESSNDTAGNGNNAMDEKHLPIGNGSLDEYIPLLEWLAENKAAIQNLLGASTPQGKIPRFTLPGQFITKSVHMTTALDQMVRDFSREKNIVQREIFEVALIEFFQKYGYAKEVEYLIGE
jgi:hypothetical protein